MYRYHVTLVIETEEDPSAVLDLAIEAGQGLADDTDGYHCENEACVQSVTSKAADADVITLELTSRKENNIGA